MTDLNLLTTTTVHVGDLKPGNLIPVRSYDGDITSLVMVTKVNKPSYQTAYYVTNVVGDLNLEGIKLSYTSSTPIEIVSA